MSPDQARFEDFIAPARTRPELWRLAAGFVLAIAVWMAAAAPLLWLAGHQGGRAVLLTYLASFGALILGLWLATRLFQRRDFMSLIGPGGLRPGPFLAGAAVILALGLATAFLLDAPVRHLSLRDWVIWLPFAMTAIALQTGAEELMFRGYLTQGLAVRFRARWIWWGVPAVLFGTLHWNGPEYGANAGWVVVSAILTGLILADVTARTGNLSLAMGLHFANNFAALLLVATASPLSGLSLWLSLADPTDAATFRTRLILDMAMTLALYLGWRGIRSRREEFRRR